MGESPPVESQDSEQTPLLSKLLLRERSLSAAESILSPRLSQQFMSKGWSM